MSDRTSNAGLAAEARGIIHARGHAALGTMLEGRPYVSLVAVGFAVDGRPLLLLSDLAQHTRNLLADARVSLLFDATAGQSDPLAGPRLTLLGRAERYDDPDGLAGFVARHASAQTYAGFADFHLYRISIERGHFVAGFGRIAWIEGPDLLLHPGGLKR